MVREWQIQSDVYFPLLQYNPIQGYDSIQAVLHAGDGHDIEPQEEKAVAVEG